MALFVSSTARVARSLKGNINRLVPTGLRDEQATALEEAAAAGLPFCEECERARVVDPSLVDHDHQAAVLEEAATSGTAFCEECERARVGSLDQASANQDEQAATLQDAATAGGAFCEECARGAAGQPTAAAEAT